MTYQANTKASEELISRDDMGLFWSSAKPSTARESSVLLQQVQAQYYKRIQHLERQRAKLREDARAHLVNGYRILAHQFLARRQRLLKQIQTLQHYDNVVDTLRGEIEQMSLTIATVDSIRSASLELGDLRKRVNPADVEQLLDQVRDHVELQREALDLFTERHAEIQEAQLGVPIDEDELERELEQLSREPVGDTQSLLLPAPNSRREQSDENDSDITALHQSMTDSSIPSSWQTTTKLAILANN